MSRFFASTRKAFRRVAKAIVDAENIDADERLPLTADDGASREFKAYSEDPLVGDDGDDDLARQMGYADDAIEDDDDSSSSSDEDDDDDGDEVIVTDMEALRRAGYVAYRDGAASWYYVRTKQRRRREGGGAKVISIVAARDSQFYAFCRALTDLRVPAMGEEPILVPLSVGGHRFERAVRVSSPAAAAESRHVTDAPPGRPATPGTTATPFDALQQQQSFTVVIDSPRHTESPNRARHIEDDDDDVVSDEDDGFLEYDDDDYNEEDDYSSSSSSSSIDDSDATSDDEGSGAESIEMRSVAVDDGAGVMAAAVESMPLRQRTNVVRVAPTMLLHASTALSPSSSIVAAQEAALVDAVMFRVAPHRDVDVLCMYQLYSEARDFDAGVVDALRVHPSAFAILTEPRRSLGAHGGEEAAAALRRDIAQQQRLRHEYTVVSRIIVGRVANGDVHGGGGGGTSDDITNMANMCTGLLDQCAALDASIASRIMASNRAEQQQQRSSGSGSPDILR